METATGQRIDPELFRRVMGSFASGVTVIAAERPDGGVQAMTANAFMSGSLEPPLCVVAVGLHAKMHAVLDAREAFSISILAQGQEADSNRFAGRMTSDLRVTFNALEGVPVIPDALSHIVCRKAAVHPCGDHSLFVGAIVALRTRSGEPLVYRQGRYGGFDAGTADSGSAPPLW